MTSGNQFEIPGDQEIVAVVGATGTGKSNLSLDIAEWLASQGRRAEIVNADAMQLYRGMNIGTAKLSVEERRGIPHHMLDVLDVTDEAAVAAYQTQARGIIVDVLGRGATPIIVGGSGLYVSSVLFDFDFPGHDDDIRQRLEQELESDGLGALFQRLKSVAPGVAARIDQSNARRVVRALEVVEIRGDGASLGEIPEKPTLWKTARIFGLHSERAELIERLDRRVERMWQDGLLDEVSALIPVGLERGVTARRAIGYAQALAQLAGTMTQQEAIAETQALTRRYARRQVGWFKRYSDVTWLTAPVGLSHGTFAALH